MGSDSSPLLFKSLKRFLAGVVTTLLWACAITQVLITRCLIPALQLILMLLQEAASLRNHRHPMPMCPKPSLLLISRRAPSSKLKFFVCMQKESPLLLPLPKPPVPLAPWFGVG